MPMRMQSLVKNAFPLIAEDIRAARARLGITTSVAAERAQLSPDLYRGLEEGSVVRNVENLRLMVSICQSLGTGGGPLFILRGSTAAILKGRAHPRRTIRHLL